MEGKSLYEIGQKLYTLDDFKVKEFTVSGIWISISSDKKVSVEYRDENGYKVNYHNEKHCFPTREMLIHSLG